MPTWDNICDMKAITPEINGTRMRTPLDTLGSRLKWLRDISGMRQEDARDLAQNLSGVTFGQSYLSELENDKKTPGGDVVLALAMAYNTSTDFILGRIEDPRSYDEIARGKEVVSGDDGGVIKVLGKGRKERWVRLSARTRKELLRYIAERGQVDETEPLWVGTKGRLKVNGLFQAMKRIGKRAGVWPVGLHRFRRTFAIASVRNGMDVHRLREILGHADLSTAQQYLKFAREDIVDIHKKTSPVDNWRL